MSLVSLLIVLLIFIISGLIIIRPFLVEPEIRVRSSSSRYDSLLAERERLFSALEELDQELELGKIDPGEHSRSRDLLLNEAALVLQKLDQLPTPAARDHQPPVDEKDDDRLEALIAARRKELQSSRGNTCPDCGQAAGESDQFCSQCGATL